MSEDRAQGDASAKTPEALWIRFSSFGDLILSREGYRRIRQQELVSEAPAGRSAHRFQWSWLVGAEFQGLLKYLEPEIHVVSFQRRTPFMDQLRALWAISSHSYAQVVDAQGNWRSWLLCLLIRVRHPDARVVSVDRDRFHRALFFLLKRYCPAQWRPRHWLERIEGIAPAVLDRSDISIDAKPVRIQPSSSATSRRIAIAPGAAWPGKAWPLDLVVRWVEGVAAAGDFQIQIVGGAQDEACHALEKELKARGISAVFEPTDSDLSRLQHILENSRFLLAGDTGPAHFAQSLGVPTVALFGPTHPDLGFGPWGLNARAITSSLWCSPCSSDGTGCFRQGKNRYLCMKTISPNDVTRETLDWMQDNA